MCDRSVSWSAMEASPRSRARTICSCSSRAFAENPRRQGPRLPATESRVAVGLGSGLGAFADALTDARALPFAELPGFPPATVPGHKGRMVYGKLAPTSVLVLQGRIHGYEGHDAATVALPARVLGALGAR